MDEPRAPCAPSTSTRSRRKGRTRGYAQVETAPLAVVVLSTLLFGGLTGPLLRYLDLDHAAPPPGGDREAGRGGVPDAEDPEGDDQDGDVAYSKGVLLFKTFDTKVLQPFFGGEGRGGGGPSLLWEGDKGVKRR